MWDKSMGSWLMTRPKFVNMYDAARDLRKVPKTIMIYTMFPIDNTFQWHLQKLPKVYLKLTYLIFVVNLDVWVGNFEEYLQ